MIYNYHSPDSVLCFTWLNKPLRIAVLRVGLRAAGKWVTTWLVACGCPGRVLRGADSAQTDPIPPKPSNQTKPNQTKSNQIKRLEDVQLSPIFCTCFTWCLSPRHGQDLEVAHQFDLSLYDLGTDVQGLLSRGQKICFALRRLWICQNRSLGQKGVNNYHQTTLFPAILMFRKNVDFPISLTLLSAENYHWQYGNTSHIFPWFMSWSRWFSQE